MGEEKNKFSKIAFLAVSSILVSTIAIFQKSLNPPKGITGNSIGSEIGGFYSQISPLSKIFFILQCTILVALLVFLAYRRKKLESMEDEIKDISQWKKPQKGTDLDVLYDLLKDKKEIGISKIAELFNIKKEVAIEWAKILEAGNLATLNYPGFGDPQLKILNPKQDNPLNMDKICQVSDNQQISSQNTNENKVQ